MKNHLKPAAVCCAALSAGAAQAHVEIVSPGIYAERDISTGVFTGHATPIADELMDGDDILYLACGGSSVLDPASGNCLPFSLTGPSGGPGAGDGERDPSSEPNDTGGGGGGVDKGSGSGSGTGTGCGTCGKTGDILGLNDSLLFEDDEHALTSEV